MTGSPRWERRTRTPGTGAGPGGLFSGRRDQGAGHCWTPDRPALCCRDEQKGGSLRRTWQGGWGDGGYGVEEGREGKVGREGEGGRVIKGPG